MHETPARPANVNRPARDNLRTGIDVAANQHGAVGFNLLTAAHRVIDNHHLLCFLDALLELLRGRFGSVAVTGGRREIRAFELGAEKHPVPVKHFTQSFVLLLGEMSLRNENRRPANEKSVARLQLFQKICLHVIETRALGERQLQPVFEPLNRYYVTHLDHRL